MDRSQFNTVVGSKKEVQIKDEYYSPENAAIYKFSENDSDSGEDFDYGEEEDGNDGGD